MELAARDELLMLAEDAWAYYPPSGGIVLEDVGDCVLMHVPNPSPFGGGVHRARFAAADFDRRIQDVRAWMAAHDRAEFTWGIGAHAEPADLAERLIAHGCVLQTDEVFTPMVLDREPPARIRPEIEIRRVDNFADFRRALVVAHDAWEEPDEFRLAELRSALTKWRALQGSDDHWTYLALVDGIAVGYGTLAKLNAPAYLLGNAGVVPEARGQGIYSALIKARWDDARRMGARALVITAGEMSKPLLDRFGLRAGAPIRVFLDRSDATQ